MALEVVKGTTPARTTAGTTVVSPTGITDLKAVIFWATYETADGITDGDNIFCLGFADNNGGTIHQGYVTHWDDDAVLTSAVGTGMNTTAVIKLFTAAPTAGIDAIASVSAWSATSFTLNWTDPATSAVLIHYLALGGSDISAARVFSFTETAAVATQDVTVVAGFGQPDLILLAANGQLALSDQATHGAIITTIAKSSTEAFAIAYRAANAAATMNLSSWGKAKALLNFTSGGIADAEADLSAKGSWPADGFQLSYTDQSALAQIFIGLALKGTFTATIGNTTVPTAGAPQTQNLALASGTPKGGIFFTHHNVASPTVQQTGTRLGGFGIGATDGTNEGFAGILQEDANTASIAGRAFTATKALSTYDAGSPATLGAECDSSISGSNVVLTWNDTEVSAIEYCYLILGAAAVSTPKAPQFISAGMGYF